jgi:PAP2 superfamily/Vanadium chloroperoxidase N-terminal domain
MRDFESDTPEEGGPVMIRFIVSKLIVLLVIGSLFAISHPAKAQDPTNRHQDLLGPNFQLAPTHPPIPRQRSKRAAEWIRNWNEVALDANALDHTPVAAGEARVFGEQLGPGRTSRALAIVHIAMFDAVNAIVGGYDSYTDLPRVHPVTSIRAAIAQAAHDTLATLYPSQKARFAEELTDDLSKIQEGRAKADGVALGRKAAAAILALRSNDGSNEPDPRVGIDYVPKNDPGIWRPDPVSQIPIALGWKWGKVLPFVLKSADQFRVPPAPDLTRLEYAAAFNEAKRLGGDGLVTPTQRTEEETQIGIFWGYDGTPGLGTPPRLYNQIALRIAEQRGSDAIELARLLALVNVAMADAGFACWDSKYTYEVWRPVTGIREADEGTGPTGSGDGNAATVGDSSFSPLGAPASNLIGPNFTPPFPAYPSGHATFGGALFQILRQFYRTDRIRFSFVSDELNGETLDNQGGVRPLVRRHYSSLSQAEEENGQSRIYLGIHWAFDKTAGITQGRQVADYVFKNAFTPLLNGRR